MNLGHISNSKAPHRKICLKNGLKITYKKEKNTPPEHKTKHTVSTHSMTQVALALQAQWAVDIASANIL